MSVRRTSGALAALAAAAALALLSASPAQAHNVLLGTSPKSGATVAVVPDQVVLTFDKPALALGTALRVTGPTGDIEVGKAVLVDTDVTQPVRGGAPAGRYTVTWRVTSADGHPIEGGFTFVAKAASRPTASSAAEAAAASAAASTTTSGGGGSSSLAVVGAAAVAGAVVGTGFVLARRRRRSRA